MSAHRRAPLHALPPPPEASSPSPLPLTRLTVVRHVLPGRHHQLIVISLGKGGSGATRLMGWRIVAFHRSRPLPPMPPALASPSHVVTVARCFLHDRHRKLIVVSKEKGGDVAPGPVIVVLHRLSSRRPTTPPPRHRPPLSSPHMLPSLTSPFPFVSDYRLCN